MQAESTDRFFESFAFLSVKLFYQWNFLGFLYVHLKGSVFFNSDEKFALTRVSEEDHDDRICALEREVRRGL